VVQTLRDRQKLIFALDLKKSQLIAPLVFFFSYLQLVLLSYLIFFTPKKKVPFSLSFFFVIYISSKMGESKPDYKVVIDQEPEQDNNGNQQQTVVAPSGIKLSPGVRAVLPVASYCCASILMTVTNKYVLSGYDFNMNFLLLTIQVSFYI
jgi:hypothetical protein